MMDKSREELEREYAANAARLEAYRHRQQRLENRLRHYKEKDRKERTHRLVTRGAAVESVVPAVRGMSEVAFYDLMEQVFSLPEVSALVRTATQREGG